jgi:NADPH-dependent 2,4-dienoyl-CoA reductase/sulfur reductase-like enzyme
MHIVIVGNGIAGITAARHVRKHSSTARITVISAETDHFFSRTALMYIYMGHMTFEHTKPYEDGFWATNRIRLVRDWVTMVDTDAKTVELAALGPMAYDKLVLALGSRPNKFGWPGQDLEGVQGLYSHQDLQLLEGNTHPPGTPNPRVKRAVIVGGGLIGVELAEMLRTRGIEVTFLVREDRFWGNVLPEPEGQLVAEQLRTHHVDLRLNTNLREILADDEGRARAVVTDGGETIECQLVGLTAGVHPNVGWLKEHPTIEVDRGILVDDHLQTSAPDVYAAGDCAQVRTPTEGRRAIEAVWYVGRMMGEALGRTLTGTPTAYRPGHWFNSAKFFDVEYQTYGLVGSTLEEGQAEFVWRDGDVLLHLVYRADDQTFVGLNTFGWRLRHEVADRWLREGATVQTVVAQLRDAHFDPELYARHEADVVAAFNQQTGSQVVLQKMSWGRIFARAMGAR